MQAKLVAVPKSTTMTGGWGDEVAGCRLPVAGWEGEAAAVFLNISWAATQLTMRSAPTSAGLSVRMGRPVRTPGSTKIGLTLKLGLVGGGGGVLGGGGGGGVGGGVGWGV